MKNKLTKLFSLTTILYCTTFSSSSFGQNIGINSSGATPDVSAMLDIVSSDKGMLLPRVALVQTTSNAPIGASIANSLLIYNTATVNDVTPGFYYWNGTTWSRLLNTGGLDGNGIYSGDGTTPSDVDVTITDNINFGDSTLFIDGTNDRVGIGTTNPDDILTINDDGTSSASNYVKQSINHSDVSVDAGVGLNHQFYDGTTFGPGHQLYSYSPNFTSTYDAVSLQGITRLRVSSNNSNTGLLIDSKNGDITFGTNNLRRMVIDNSGNIGVGTTAPTHKLETQIETASGVSGTTLTSHPIAKFGNIQTGLGAIRGLEFGAPSGSVSGPVYLKVSGTANRFAIIDDNDHENLTILDDGKVGIGTNSPTTTLALGGDRIISTDGVANAINIQTGATNQRSFLNVIPNGTPTPGTQAMTIWDANPFSAPAGNEWLSFGKNVGGNADISMNASGTGVFRGMNFRVNNAIAMIIETSGNIGIGTTTPNERLEVNGNIRMTDGNQAANTVMVGDVNGTASWAAVSSLNDGNGIYGGDGTAPSDVDVTITDNINFGDSTLFIDGTNDRVGIGTKTTNPGNQLSIFNDDGVNHARISVNQGDDSGNLLAGYSAGVSDGVTIGGSFQLYAHGSNNSNLLDGVALSGKVKLRQSTNGGTGLMFQTSNNTSPMYFLTNSKVRMYIDPSTDGNIGIGTTSPDRKLHVFNGSAGTVTALSAAELVLEDDDAVALQMLSPNTESNIIYFGDNDNTNIGSVVYSHNLDRMTFETNNSVQMAIMNNGNVGIGTTTPSTQINSNATYFRMNPSGKIVTINSSSNEAILNLESGQSSTGDHLGGIYFTKTTGQADGHKQIAAIQARQASYGGSATLAGGELLFFTKISGNGVLADDPRMLIDQNGNVGIGTTAPLDKLNVYDGHVSVSKPIVSTTEYDWLTMRSNRTINDYGGLNREYAKIKLVTHGTTTTGEGNNHTRGDVRFALANSAGAFSDKMTIRNNGNIGIGTTTPDNLLEIVGNSSNYVEIGQSANNYSNLILGTQQAGYPFIAKGIIKTAANNSYIAETDNNAVVDHLAIELSNGGFNFLGQGHQADATTLSLINLLRINTNGNIGIGTITPAYKLEVSGEIMLEDVATPTASAGHSGIYSSAGELNAFDASGNSTVISPHHFSLTKPSEKMAWSFYSKNENIGEQVNVDMMKLTRLVENLSGEKLVYRADLDGNEINKKNEEVSLKETVFIQDLKIEKQNKLIEKLIKRIEALEK